MDNAAINGLEARIEARTSTLESEHEGREFSLIVANIRPEVLLPLAPRIPGHLRPGGAVVLSGILEEEHEELERAYRDAGLVTGRKLHDGEWTALLMGAPR